MVNTTEYEEGWLTGKFGILHMGHINYIHHAATLCKKLTVVLSHSDKRFSDPRLSLRNRKLWLQETFKDMPHIKIVHVDETEVPEYPNGWPQWSELVRGVIGDKTNVIFTSEPGDVEGYNKWFPDHVVHLVDPERSEFNISATMIRENLTKHWGMLPTVVRRSFVTKVCIMGLESTGKTTLTKMLARYFQTSWCEEYGRVFCEEDLHRDEGILHLDDYATIAIRRYEEELKAIKSANRVMFSDTSALSTNYFSQLYEGKHNHVAQTFQDAEDYDMIIMLEPDVEWVDDGLRKNPDREYNARIFETMLAGYMKTSPKTKLVRIKGNYNTRYTQSIAAVKDLLAQPVSIH